MRWYHFRLKTTVEAEDIVASMLMDLGIEGVEIENSVPLSPDEMSKMFVDIEPEAIEITGDSYLNFYVEDGIDPGSLLVDIKSGLNDLADFLDIGDGLIEVKQTDDVDWINNWKEYFHQFYVDDLLITPSWEEVQESDQAKTVIHRNALTAINSFIGRQLNFSFCRSRTAGRLDKLSCCFRKQNEFIGPSRQRLNPDL